MGPLCLDLATKTGYAFRSGGSLAVGTANFEPRRGEGAGYRFLRFRAWLNETYKLQPFGVVYYEQVVGISPRPGQAGQQQTYGGLLATLMTWCEDNGVPYSGVPVPSIKKAATGKGNAKKEDMLRVAHERLTAERRLDQSPIDDNGADAYMLLCLVESEGFAP